jgi:hypothetical protein
MRICGCKAVASMPTLPPLGWIVRCKYPNSDPAPKALGHFLNIHAGKTLSETKKPRGHFLPSPQQPTATYQASMMQQW